MRTVEDPAPWHTLPHGILVCLLRNELFFFSFVYKSKAQYLRIFKFILIDFINERVEIPATRLTTISCPLLLRHSTNLTCFFIFKELSLLTNLLLATWLTAFLPPFFPIQYIFSLSFKRWTDRYLIMFLPRVYWLISFTYPSFFLSFTWRSTYRYSRTSKVYIDWSFRSVESPNIRRTTTSLPPLHLLLPIQVPRRPLDYFMRITIG